VITLLVATNNAHKRRELAALLAGLEVELKSPLDLGPHAEPVEDGNTFAENAARKALHYHRLTGWTALADDSGLEVQALAGAPGVHSARYAGAHASDAENRAKLLAALAGVPAAARGARFRCSLAVADRGSIVLTAEGSVAGEILDQERGSGGFGYDPLFFCQTVGRTFAELGEAEKNVLSHRARALKALLPELRRHLTLRGNAPSTRPVERA
jgi:XTP/dITP diphosphohydrolase